MDLAKSSTTMSGRLRFNRVLADACYVYSLLSIRTGRFKDAARHAKQCVTVNRRIWAALESKSAAKRAVRPDNTESDAEGSNTETFDPLSSIRNDQGLPVVISNTHSSLDGPEFWSLVPSLYRGLMQQSLVFTHQGLLQEAMYVAEQAEKVAAATNSRALALDNVSRRADYWAQSGKSDKAQAALKNVDINSGLVHPSMLGYHSSVARIYHADRMYDEELGAYTAMETMVNKLVLPPLLGETHYDDPAMDQLTQKMSAIGLQQTATKGKPPIKTTKARKPVQSTVRVPTKPSTRTAQNPSRKALPPSDTQPSSTAEDFSSLTAIRLEVLGRKALARLAQEDVVQASKFLDEASALSNGLEGSYLHSWARFRALLMGSMKKLSSDFTFNTLPESTIAFPALNQKAHQSPEGPTTKRVNVAPTKAKRTTKVSKISKQEFVTTLEEAREQLAELHKICAQTGASYSFQQASSALSSITVLLSAISGGEVRGSLHPLYVAYMNGMFSFATNYIVS
jgi:separase